MADWNADQYLKFADERTRPAIDLLARIPAARSRRVVDLGCGPGNSTELLVERFPDAEVVGLDTSPDMLAAARTRLPTVRFEQADLAGWSPRECYDLIFANAVLQWVPDHERLLPCLASLLSRGGWLAVQMPDNLDEPSHVLMRAASAAGPWSAKLAAAAGQRSRIGSFTEYYEMLTPLCSTIEMWRTAYVHPLDGTAGIIEWLKATGLRPFLDPLDENERSAFLAAYRTAITEAYPLQSDGKVLLPFPRLFIVARRRG